MLLECKNISFKYKEKSPLILEKVNFKIESKERIALVAPSGYGKSTLGKILAGYLEPLEGEVLLDGKKINPNIYSPVQLIHQHPEQAVNPRWKMDKIVNECWQPDETLLRSMGIEKEWMNRWPAEISGGELQRFCITRVLNPKTKFLICDEITTMLDVISQAQIWDILLREADKNNIGLVVITHNMSLAEKVCDKIIRLD